jgi:DNA-binding response OmpR family regulator
VDNGATQYGDLPLTRVLVVEDDPLVGEVLDSLLQEAGYQADWTRSGREARKRVQAQAPDLVLLDLGLPDLDGRYLYREILASTPAQVVVCSGTADPRDRVQALEWGAADVIGKPFDPDELLARVRKVLRSRGPLLVREEPTDWPVDGIVLDGREGTLEVRGEPVKFTASQRRLLSILARDPDRIWSKGDLAQALNGDHGESASAVHALLRKTRQCARERLPKNVALIETMGHNGWRLGATFRPVAQKSHTFTRLQS